MDFKHGSTIASVWSDEKARTPEMYLDITDLQAFYSSPLGRTSGALIRRRLREAWPNLNNYSYVCIGYAPPVLRGVGHGLALMPGQQGVSHWPAGQANRAVLVEDLSLPLADASVDRLVLFHALEHTPNPGQLLREVWRVLTPEGRVMAILPNRRSLWALMERTPFGHGRPYSVGQASRLLSEKLFYPESWRGALYCPPLGKGVGVRARHWLETPVGRVAPALAGVILVEASKSVEARIDGTATAPALAYARA